MKNNIISLTDSYKPSHWKVYPKEMTYMQSHFESRVEGEETVFYGLYPILKKHLEGVRITTEVIDGMEAVFRDHFGREDVFNRKGFERIRDRWGGRIPVKIHAVPEGSVVPTRTPLIIVESLDPKIPWIVNYIEGVLTHVWYPTTVASYTREIKKTIYSAMQETMDGPDRSIRTMLPFKHHDFGFRGATCVEQAEIGGAAALLNFWGTDNVPALLYIKEMYTTDLMAGFSIPATEHSTMTTGDELAAMRRYLEKYQSGAIACVSDSHDIMRAVDDYWGKELKDEVLARDGMLVIRPDSGDPVVTLSKIMKSLWDSYGGHENTKGFKVLDPHVSVIQGDGVNHKAIKSILDAMKADGFSAQNITFGSGGGLIQDHTRDSYKFAFKCNYIQEDGTPRNVKKSPMEWTSKGEYVKSFKYSKSGDLLPEHGSRMNLVFNAGTLLNSDSFEDIRERAEL